MDLCSSFSTWLEALSIWRSSVRNRVEFRYKNCSAMRFCFLVLQFFTCPPVTARGRATSFRQTVMMFSPVRMMPKGMVE